MCFNIDGLLRSNTTRLGRIRDQEEEEEEEEIAEVTKHSWAQAHVVTRKLCYRKDDRAMRPTYGCPS